jgi:hypothetical protein
MSETYCEYAVSDNYTKIIAQQYISKMYVCLNDTFKNFLELLNTHKIILNYTKLFVEIMCITKSDEFARNFLIYYRHLIDINSHDTDANKSSPAIFACKYGLPITRSLLIDTYACDTSYTNLKGESIYRYYSARIEEKGEDYNQSTLSEENIQVEPYTMASLIEENNKLKAYNQTALSEENRLSEENIQLKEQLRQMSEQIDNTTDYDDRKRKTPRLF